MRAPVKSHHYEAFKAPAAVYLAVTLSVMGGAGSLPRAARLRRFSPHFLSPGRCTPTGVRHRAAAPRKAAEQTSAATSMRPTEA